jgi:hypothetical protein
MAWEKDWTRAKHPVTEDMIEDVGDFIKKTIDAAGGEAYIRIGEDILKHYGLQDEWREWYGTYWEAVKEAIKRNGIGYEKWGRKGGRYFYLLINDANLEKKEKDPGELKMKLSKIKQLKTLINSLNIDSLSLEEAENLLMIAEKIIS